MSTSDIIERATPNLFLVCGLKSLGQQCVAVLKGYDVRVSAIGDLRPEY